MTKQVIHYLFAPQQNEQGIWTWLNARFVEGSGFKGLDLETKTYAIKGSKTIITTERSPLERCLDVQGDIADFDSINEQGFHTQRSRRKAYQPGKNVFFWIPIQGNVAWFGSASDGASAAVGALWARVLRSG